MLFLYISYRTSTKLIHIVAVIQFVSATPFAEKQQPTYKSCSLKRDFFHIIAQWSDIHY